MSQPNKHFPVSWDQIHRDAKALAWRLVDKGQWKGIVAVTRGGLIPACIVARELNIRMIETFCIATYHNADTTEQGEASILKNIDSIGDGAGWLVIDDLVDTGNTFKIIREHLPKAHFACIYGKPEGVPTADTLVTEVSQDTWVFFPWDMEVQYVKPIVGDDD